VSERLLNAGHPLVVTLNYALEVLPRYAYGTSATDSLTVAEVLEATAKLYL